LNEQINDLINEQIASTKNILGMGWREVPLPFRPLFKKHVDGIDSSSWTSISKKLAALEGKKYDDRNSLKNALISLVEKSKLQPYQAKIINSYEIQHEFCDWIDSNFLAYIMDRIPGWLLTALAISLGAPFWFDLLNKFINLRAVVNRPEKGDKPERQPVG
jgi:hypothetical protein